MHIGLKNLAIVLAASLSLVTVDYAQRRTAITKPAAPKSVEATKPAERPVKVFLKAGEPVTGTFVNSNSQGLEVLVVGNSITVKWELISQVIFTDVPQPEVAKVDDKAEKQKEAAKSAIKSLRKLVAATEVLSWGKRADMEEFGRRFIDVRADANDVLAEVADGETKDELKKALEAYDDGMTAWKWMFGDNGMGRSSGDMFPDYEPGKSLQQKYSIETYTSGSLHLMAGDKVLAAIWQAAKSHIENAEKNIK